MLFRSSSATAAADVGATPAQMTDLFWCKSPNMAQEYISTCKTAVSTLATILSNDEPDLANQVSLVEPMPERGDTIDAVAGSLSPDFNVNNNTTE